MEQETYSLENMTVQKFCNLLLDKYEPDDILYFSTAAYDNEHLFDQCEIDEREELSKYDGSSYGGQGEGCVFLRMSEESKRHAYYQDVLDEECCGLRDELISVLDNYLL